MSENCPAKSPYLAAKTLPCRAPKAYFYGPAVP